MSKSYKAKKSYKVWVEIEEFEDGEPVSSEDATHGILPDPLGYFEGRGALKRAVERMADVNAAFGSDPDNSDSLKAVAKSRAKKIVGVVLRRES